MKRKISTKKVNIIYLILQISLIVAFILRKEFFSVVGTISVFVVYLIFLYYEYKKGIKINDFTRILVLVTVLSNSFLGEYMRLYTTSVYFDKFLHIFGTFSFSIFMFSLSDKLDYFQGMKRFLIFIFIFLFGNFLGTIFEISEFLCDIIFKTANQNGLFDTNVDMICNLFGAVFAGIYTNSKIKYKTKVYK